MSKLKVIVFGATGFIGRNVIEKFSTSDDLELYGTYYQSKPDRILSSKKVTLIQADLTQKSAVNEIIKGKDIIIQAAAVTSGSKDILSKPYIHVTDNAVMNSLIFRSAFENRVKHVIFFSCTVMYPNQEMPVKEEDFNYQITDKYFGVGWTKVYLEKMCEFFSRIGNTKYTAIRHSNIYGPFDKYDLDRSHVFGATVTKILTNKMGKITVWGDGSEERDLLYVTDLVDFVEKVMSSQTERFELINVGFGSAISVANLVKKIIELSGKKLDIEYDTSKPTIKFNLSLDITKSKSKYNWKPETSLEEGIKKTLQWYNKMQSQGTL